jgi:glutamate dehydrogenase (NAD(P)+)
VNVQALSGQELDKLTTAYALMLARMHFLSPAIDVPGPDFGTNEKTMALMMDAYRTYRPDDVYSLACVTGKPSIIGGIEGYIESTGLGVFYGLREFLKDPYWANKAGLTPGITGKTVILQGMGTVGFNFGKFFQDAGGIIVGIIEQNGSVYNPEGINILEAKAYYSQNGHLFGFPNAEHFEDVQKTFAMPCDILVPAAVEVAINQKNAMKL